MVKIMLKIMLVKDTGLQELAQGTGEAEQGGRRGFAPQLSQ